MSDTPRVETETEKYIAKLKSEQTLITTALTMEIELEESRAGWYAAKADPGISEEDLQAARERFTAAKQDFEHNPEWGRTYWRSIMEYLRETGQAPEPPEGSTVIMVDHIDATAGALTPGSISKTGA